MAEEIERRLALSRINKQAMTEIYQLDGDNIKELSIKFKSGDVMVLRF